MTDSKLQRKKPRTDRQRLTAMKQQRDAVIAALRHDLFLAAKKARIEDIAAGPIPDHDSYWHGAAVAYEQALQHLGTDRFLIETAKSEGAAAAIAEYREMQAKR